MVGTVFIVGDDPEFSAALAERLAREGYRVLLFADTDRALRSITGLRPSLIIADLEPTRGTRLLLARLRAESQWSDIPVVVVSDGNDTSLPLRFDAPVVYKPAVDDLIRVASSVIAVGQSTTS